MDGESALLGEKKSEVEGKAIQHPWSRKEGWRELSSGGKWTKRQDERCHAEALGSSDRYDPTQ